uniref:Nonstructural protein n=1 Tax=Dulem virus 164 TaxID=3145641 RepID=A0AAU8B1E0_9VIRU
MTYGIYCIFDEAAGVFTAPTIDISDASAVRNFQKMCQDAGSIMNFKPSDFSLYKVGDFDAETAYIDSFSVPSRLFVGSDCSILKEASDEKV